MSERSRDGKKPFTFWFEIDLKEKLKSRAGMMGTTTTDLLNRSVKYYLEKGYLEDEQESQRVSTSLIAQDIQAMAKYESEIKTLETQMKGIQASINDLEKKMNEIDQKLKEEIIPVEKELRPYIQNVVGTYFSTQLAPIMQRISDVLKKIEE